MPIFPKTGIRQTRPNNQEAEIVVQNVVRRVALLPKSNPNNRFVDGFQENADYIMYQEKGDTFKINDIVKIDYSNLYQGLPFNEDSETIIITEVKEVTRLYGTLNLNSRNGEVFLKSIT